MIFEGIHQHIIKASPSVAKFPKENERLLRGGALLKVEAVDDTKDGVQQVFMKANEYMILGKR